MKDPANLTLAERRQRLALACQLDRLNLQLALRPSPLEKLSINLLEKLAPIAPHLPGRVGKWVRQIMRGTSLVRSLFDAVSA
jgi:hypothetical protein